MPMSVRETIKSLLIQNGLFEREADAVMETLIAGSSSAIRWSDDVSVYPASMISVLWLSARRKAVEYIDANCPLHWARPLLADDDPVDQPASAAVAEGGRMFTLPETDETPVRQLIAALRSPLPKRFQWDFRRASTCAIGLARRMGLPPPDIVESFVRGESFPFCTCETDGLVPLYGVPARDVTPAMVADALERLIAGDAR